MQRLVDGLLRVTLQIDFTAIKSPVHVETVSEVRVDKKDKGVLRDDCRDYEKEQVVRYGLRRAMRVNGDYLTNMDLVKDGD